MFIDTHFIKYDLDITNSSHENIDVGSFHSEEHAETINLHNA